jgi:hypothetical protein
MFEIVRRTERIEPEMKDYRLLLTQNVDEALQLPPNRTATRNHL